MHEKRYYQRIYRASITSIAVMLACSVGFAETSAAHDEVSGVPIVVNTTDDEINSDGDCSLREALRAANTDTSVDACPAGNGNDTILLPIGMYTLTRGGINEDEGLTGDLDIYSNMSISGAGMKDTIVDGNQIDRVFHITGNFEVNLSGLTIQNGTFTGGGPYGGGGILNQDTEANLTLTKVIMTANHADEGNGGGLDNVGRATLFDVSIIGNSAARGGGVFSDGSQLNLRGVTLSLNSAIDSGGGLDNSGNADINNSTFSGNSAPEGGGIYNQGDINLLNSTFNNNSMAFEHEGGNIRVKNTIVAGSTPGDNCTGRFTLTSNGNNLDSGESCNFTSTNDLSNEDPLLDVLQDNQGFTWTHALLEGSPAIDKGDNLDCPSTDQRGAYRPADGDGNDSKICDIGAFEHSGTFPSLMFLPITFR